MEVFLVTPTKFTTAIEGETVFFSLGKVDWPVGLFTSGGLFAAGEVFTGVILGSLESANFN